ncbi:MAG: DNA-3-methyladenine glycosylase family protein [Sandaracinaceae bacterium]
MAADATRLVPVEGPLDLVRTLRRYPVWGSLPTFRVEDGGVWWGIQTEGGPAGVHYRWEGAAAVRVEGFGPGGEAAVARAEDHLGVRDDPTVFQTDDPVLAPLLQRNPGLRFGRTMQIMDVLVATIIAQKVTGAGAYRSYRDLVFRHGVKLDAPVPLWAPPSAETLTGLGYYDFHPLGVERKRAMTILRIARRARSLEGMVQRGDGELRARLLRLPGVGPWTAETVLSVALGDPDAVPTGDYNLPDMVAWTLAGEARADDDRMLELLEPFRPHRGRVVRLLLLTGRKPPRFGPRLPVRDIRRH